MLGGGAWTPESGEMPLESTKPQNRILMGEPCGDFGGLGRADTGRNCRNRIRMMITTAVCLSLNRGLFPAGCGGGMVLFPWDRCLGMELRVLGRCVCSRPWGRISGWVSLRFLLDYSCRQPLVLIAANAC